ncbi:MAG: hypothetical protein JNM74_16485, partial [Myxococcales bacterium]|nr:hypothetical protein [Myxococcales bacterium]
MPAPPAVPVELVATNQSSFCVRMSDGTVRCWGSDKYLGLGNGGVVDVSRAVPVVGLEGSKRLVGGVYSVCSLSGEGVLSCWGADVSPAEHFHADARKPRAVAKQVTDVALTGRAVCTKTSGDWACLRPRSGPGSPPVVDWVQDPAVPHLPVASGPARWWAPLVVDQHHTSYSACGIDAKGSVLCAGSNEAGELGTGKDGGIEKSFVAAAGLTDAVQVVEASMSFCALRKGGTIACWGFNNGGGLGFPPDAKPCSSTKYPCTRVPTTIPGLDDAVEVARAFPLCARRANGEVHCLAYKDGVTSFRKVPLPAAAAQLAASLGTACALLADHTVHCWGDDRYGQTGRGRLLESATAVKVPELHDITHLDASLYGAAVGKDGNLVLWGGERPKKPVNLSKVSKVAGRCALRTDGTVWCWGHNADGILGDATRTRPPNEDETDPRKVPGLPDTIALASAHVASAACALDKLGTARCWGENFSVQLPGYPLFGPLPKPVKLMGVPKLREVTTEYALDEAGGVWVWDTLRRKKNAPVKLEGIPPVLHLSQHAPRPGSRWGAGGTGCFGLTDGRVHCDGPNPVVEGLTDVVSVVAHARP